MNILNKGLSAALCGLILSAQASAGAIAELERLSKTAPENFGRVYDNNTAAAGNPQASTYSQDEIKRLMYADLDAIGSQLAARYAPGGFKGQVNGFDLQAEIAEAKARIASDDNITLKEYQQIVQRLFNSLQDYHVSVNFHSTEYGVLPLRFTYSGGKYYIASVMRQVLPESVFPFKEGDEVTSFGGKPIDQAVEEYMAELGIANVPGTDRALIAGRLTSRRGASGDLAPQGRITVGFKPAGAAAEVPFDLNWIYGKELITSPFKLKLGGANSFLPMSWLAEMRVDLQALTGYPAAAGIHDIGDKNGPLPALGVKTWDAPASSYYRAYTFINPVDGRRGGYIRIPGYSINIKEIDKIMADYGRLLAEFNDRTDYLVIDQLNNGGGYVFYMYAVLAQLTDKPLTVPLQRISLTQSDVAEAIQFLQEAAQVKTEADAKAFLGGDNVIGYQTSLKLFQDMTAFYAAIVQQWGQGKTFTDPLPSLGVAAVQPAYGVKYTKPVMVLINGLDFSCGDFFPAILQDNGRAVLFGERTAGAGGQVKNYKYQNSLLGMNSFNLTATLAIRPNGQPIESLGVSPDIPYAVQPGDLQQGYKAYAAAVNAASARLR